MSGVSNRLRYSLVCSLVVLLVGGCADGSGEEQGEGVSHAVSDIGVSEVDPVSSVSGVGWEWEAPGGQSISSVQSSQGGPLMILSSGIVGLDGASGEEIWHYLVPEAEEFIARVATDGSSVLLVHGEEESESPDESLLLDAQTGELLAEFDPSAEDWEPGLVNEDARAFVSGPENLVTVMGLETGETWWQQSEQLTCESEPDAEITHQGVYAMYESVAVTVTNCRVGSAVTTQAIAGLAVETGEEVWRWETEEEGLHHFRTVGNHMAVSLPTGGALAVLDVRDGSVIRESGVDLLDLREDGYLVRDREADSEGDVFEFRGFEGEVLESATLFEQNELASYSWGQNAALTEGVVSIQSRLGGPDLTELSAAFTPWGAEEFTVLEAGFPAGPKESANPSDLPGLFSVPGAVVLLEPERPAQRVIAYQ